MIESAYEPEPDFAGTPGAPAGGKPRGLPLPGWGKAASGASADRFGVWMTVAVYVLAALIFLDAPILAYSWSAKAFPGFIVEQTLVVSDTSGPGWNGRALGIGHPLRVARIGDIPVRTPQQFESALAGYAPGEYFSLQTVSPDGSMRFYPAVPMMSFPAGDLARLFWLPYTVGLVFLGLGGWVLRKRVGTRPGRAFAYFCANAAIANGLLFDLYTSHIGAVVWTLALAQIGGSLFSLALLFPEQWWLVNRRPWARFLPDLAAVLLAGWALVQLYNRADPWAYIQGWRVSYLFILLGIAALIAVLFFRMLTSRSVTVQQQVRITLFGSLLAFAPLGVWLASPYFGAQMRWNPLVFLPFLMLFPLAIGVAIQRYRMWEIEFLINRTLVYSTLTGLLLLAYFGVVVILEQVFYRISGEVSPLAITISAMAITLLVNPLRGRVQNFIDRRFFRRKYDIARTLADFGTKMRSQVDLETLTRELLAVVQETMQPADVSLCACEGFGSTLELQIPKDDPVRAYFLNAPEAIELEHLELPSPTINELRQRNVQLLIPLVNQGELVGVLNLGPRMSEQPYSPDDRRLLSMLADQAAPAVRVAQFVTQQQAEALERQRFEGELRVAKLVQQTLLPRQMPDLDGWQLGCYYQPAREVGGDFYDFFPFSDGRWGIAVGDVTDKGVPAAMVMAATRSLLRSTAMQLVSPGQVLAAVNDLLDPDIPPNMFVTCLYMLLDPATGQLAFANAGHNLPYLRHSAGVSELHARGMPLGLLPGMEYEECAGYLGPGECLLLFSDGLVEAHDPDRQMYGFPRLKEVMAGLPPDTSLVESLVENLASFTGAHWEQEDDVTLLVLQRLGTR